MAVKIIVPHLKGSVSLPRPWLHTHTPAPVVQALPRSPERPLGSQGHPQPAVWPASRPLEQFQASAGPADGRPGPSGQCQPADRRVRTSGWKFPACMSSSARALSDRGQGVAAEDSEFHLAGTQHPSTELAWPHPLRLSHPGIPDWQDCLLLSPRACPCGSSTPFSQPAPRWASGWEVPPQECPFSFRRLDRPQKLLGAQSSHS